VAGKILNCPASTDDPRTRSGKSCCTQAFTAVASGIFYGGLPGPGIPFSLTGSSVIRSRPVSSVNTHFVRTQCDLGERLSKLTTELMSGEWE